MSQSNSSISLPFSLHFWSCKEEVLVRETDFGVYRLVVDVDDILL